ncbi:unnamed protein product [Thelazia callipaeda]|uniref:Transportin-1 n=1 Tax=Thelazia callipaeda TaxID=103827 RepID=A0A0N5CY09_THECL|nr:unnamed protein product [Thelazia callipaeda]
MVNCVVCLFKMTGAADWRPISEELLQVVQLLHHSQSPDTQTQRNVQERLDELNSHPEFCCYLVFILSEMKNEQVANRSLAGLILKNSIRLLWERLPEPVRQFVRNKTLQAISDSHPLIRATVGIVVTSIVLHEGISQWPTLLPTLCNMLESSDMNFQEGAMGAIQKICEDSADMLSPQEHLTTLVPKLLCFFRSPSPKLRHHKTNGNFRALALNSVNCILLVQTEPLNNIMDVFLQHLFALANDIDVDVQKQLCRSLTLLLDSHLDKLASHLGNIVEFMLLRTQDSNEATALEACEFWLALAEHPQECKEALLPHLPKLIPVLVSCMKYSELDIAILKCGVEEDCAVPDRQEDIKPRFHRAKTQMQKKSDTAVGEVHSFILFKNCHILGKCSAASLDVLSSIFHDDFLPTLLPILKETLFHSNWLIKESGILALGAVAEGCMKGITPHLPELIPFLIGSLQDRKALVRSIACWTLSRYCHYVVHQDHDVYFKELLKELLARILDNNKRVQEAACSAFATLEEEANLELVPYLPEILSTLVEAFNRYQAKNLLILYDAVGTLADSVGQNLNQPYYVETIMRPLMAKWDSLGDEDKELFPLLECLSSVATALHEAFLPYCEPVFQRCTTLIGRCLQQSQLAMERPNEYDMPDKDFLIVALDLLSGLAEGLAEHIDSLVGPSQIIALVYQCSMDSSAEVRQSSFALLGDLSKVCYHYIQPHINVFLPILAQNMGSESISVCNNSIWAIGEIAMKMGEGMRPHVLGFMPALIIVMNREKGPRTLLENTGNFLNLKLYFSVKVSITLGRLGIDCGNEVAPFLPQFIRPWCLSLRNIRDNKEKESAFRGLCNMISLNPAGVLAEFIFLCDAIASWNNPEPDLKLMFSRILHGFREQVGDLNWTAFTSQFPPPLKHRLAVQYDV